MKLVYGIVETPRQETDEQPGNGKVITSVQSYPQSELDIRFVPHFELLDGVKKVEAHVGYLGDVSVSVPDGQATYHHVRVPNCLHLVHVVTFYYSIKQTVQVV